MRTAIITGAGAGIGRATAERFARKGWRIVATDINAETGNATVEAISRGGGTAVFRRVDSSSPEDWEGLADWVCAEVGVPDLVVNNAGILIAGGFLQQTPDDWRRMIQVNMMGPIFGSRTFVERMAAAGTKGHIVNVASCGAFLPAAVAPSYVTAKAGVLLGTQALRSEFGKKGIRATAICPGLIRTDLAANGTLAGETAPGAWSQKLGSLQSFAWRSPKRVAAAIERSVRWNLTTVPVGWEAWLIYAIYRLSPAMMRSITSLVSMSVSNKVVDAGAKFVGGVR